MDIEILVGVDLWARTRQAIPPPPIRTASAISNVRKIEQTRDTAQQLNTFLGKELRKFDRIQGPTNKIEHVIRVKTDMPIKQKYRPRNPAIIDKEVEQMLHKIIEPSTSAWNFPIVIMKKRDGKHRFCINFRKVTR